VQRQNKYKSHYRARPSPLEKGWEEVFYTGGNPFVPLRAFRVFVREKLLRQQKQPHFLSFAFFRSNVSR